MHMWRWTYRRCAVVLLVVAAVAHLPLTNSVALYAWTMAPYGWCLLALLLRSRGRSAAWGAAAALTWDAIGYWSVRGDAMADVALIFGPLWSVGLIVPIVMAVTGDLLRSPRAPS
jgi:hypothetical protein